MTNKKLRQTCVWQKWGIYTKLTIGILLNICTKLNICTSISPPLWNVKTLAAFWGTLSNLGYFQNYMYKIDENCFLPS